MCIGTSSYLFSSSTVLALGLYFREQRSTLYTVITAGVAVEIGSGTAGKAVIVKLKLAAGKAARCWFGCKRYITVKVGWQCGTSIK